MQYAGYGAPARLFLVSPGYRGVSPGYRDAYFKFAEYFPLGVSSNQSR
jgi:hypothetical protein